MGIIEQIKEGWMQNLGGGSIETAFQSSIAWCRTCQLEKNMPQKMESRNIPDRIPLHKAPHPSKEMISEGLLTL